MSDAIYAPGSSVDIGHRLLTVRDVASLREHDESEVAAALIDLPTTKAENGYDLDPSTVETYGRYGRTEIILGSFTREALVESFESDNWQHSETHHGIDVFHHPEQPERWAAGGGDGVLLTTGRNWATPPEAFIRAHAEAIAGETDRYRDDPDMAELLSVVGGGDYVAAVTSPPDLGDRPPHTRAVGRALEVGDDGVTDTMAFRFDESAPKSPRQYAETWGGRWGKQASDDGSSNAVPGTAGRVGYFSASRPERAFTETEEGGVVAAIKQNDPAVIMGGRVSRRFAEANAMEAPDVSFSARRLSDVDADCGGGSNVIELTHRSGPPVLARRLRAVLAGAEELYRLDRCGYGFGEEIVRGASVRVGFEASDGAPFLVLWDGPYGTRKRLSVEFE